MIRLGLNQISIHGNTTNIDIEEFPPLPCVGEGLRSGAPNTEIS